MEDQSIPIVTSEKLGFWIEHRFMLLVLITIIISIVLVCISVTVYNMSGAAQLDLSRPGYQSVSGKVDRTDNVTDYSAFGPINKDTVSQFMAAYDTQASKAKAVDAFNGDPLNPVVLEFGDPTAPNE